MASGLHTKINSYTLEKGMELDEAYSLTPTQTGSQATISWSLTGNAPRRVFDGPSGGAGSSWELDCTTSSSTNTFYQSLNSTYRSTFSDGDYSIGFWFKIPTLPTNATAFHRMFQVEQSGGIAGFAIDYLGTTNTAGSFTGAKLRFVSDLTMNTLTYTTTPLLANTWYYFAVVKTGTTTSNFKAYLNGTQFANVTHSGTAGTVARVHFGRNAASAVFSAYRIANFYSTTSSAIGATEIAEIYTTGIAGYERAIQNLGTTPYNWYKFNDPSGIDLVPDSGSSNQELNLSSTPTWLTYPNAISKGGISLSAFGGYDSNPNTTYGSNNTMAFWFKRSSPPASQLQWSNKFYTSTSKWNTASEAGINTDGTIRFAPTLGTAQPALTSTTNICDNEWHYIVITRAGGTDAKMYIDGILESSQTWNTATIVSSSLQPVMGLGNQFDEFTYFDTLTLSQAQITSLYETVMGPSATNVDVTAQVMLVTDSNFPMPVHTAETVINVTYNSEAFGGDFNTATLIGPMTSLEVNLDAPGVSTASAEFALPVTTTTANIEISAAPAEATATAILPITSTEQYLNYSASPALGSALLSSNVYFGTTVQDTSYSLQIRNLTPTTNSTGNSGFIISGTRDNNVVTRTDSLAIKANSGFPTYDKIVKAKFNSAHVGVTTSGDTAPYNYFDVYVFTADPSTSFTTMTTGNIPAKEFVFTTRVVDDASSQQYYLDLTPAFADSRAHTYGIYIEINTASVGGGPTGTYYDRTQWTGSNLNNHLIYVLTTDFVNKNENAAVMTADATDVMPVITAEKYVDYTATVATASSDIVHPSVEVQTSVSNSATAVTASAAAVQPAFARTVQYTSGHLEADARTVMPTLDITGVVNYVASVSTASALFHDPQYSIGDGHEADHMNASALFVNPLVVINESVPAMVATLSAEIVDPAIGGQLLGSVSAEVMAAQTFFPIPSNFDPITNDNWYNRLKSQDIGTLEGGKLASIFFMKPAQLSSAGTLGVGSTIASLGSATASATALSSANTILSPTPAASQGMYDGWNRKSLAFSNISYTFRNPVGGSELSNRAVDRGYTLEAMIKTTKANQILFIGQNGGTFEANPIGLKDGKLFIKSSTSSALQITDAELLNATTLMQATKTNIADGQWHHVLIQFGFDGRHQFWVDGELELQRYGYRTNQINLIGYNSANSTLSSEFEMSAFSHQVERFLSERDVQLNYFAAVNFTPVQAEPMTASLRMTQDHVTKGNRGRALMLYFWSTSGLSFNNYRDYEGGLNLSLQRNTSFDQGANGAFDYDTGADLSTWELVGRPPQQWQGWDIFPVDVQGIYASSVVKPESYKGLRTAGYFSGQSPVYWNQAEGFYDETTDNRRYLDLFKDIENLEDFDMIMFRNFPDQGQEMDSYSKFESVDTYFNLQERVLYEDFIKSLQDVLTTGISMMITNPQLAIDLGIVDRVEVVPDLVDEGLNSTYAKNKILSTSGGPSITNDDPNLRDTLFFYSDTYKNNRHRLVNEVEGLTSIPAYIWKETAYYNNDGLRDFAGVDRWWNKYDYKANGLQAGDEFMISTGGNVYQAVPFENIKAGKPMTAFATTTNQNGTDVVNPYRNYATSIVLEPGDVLNGKQVAGKVFVSFTETLQKVQNYDQPREYGQIDLVTDEAINFAYSQNAITLAERNALLSGSRNLDKQLRDGVISLDQYNKLTYWDDNGNNIISQIRYNNTQEAEAQGSPVQTQERNSPLNKYAPTENPVTNFRTDGPWFTLSWGYSTPRTNIWVPPINARAFIWLYDREFLEGEVKSHTAQRASAVMVDPIISADRQRSVNAQAMLSNATITQGDYSNAISIVSLPFEVNARMTDHVKRINVLPMTASAILRETIGVLTSSIDEVVLYVYHEDPVLYLREEIIK